ncbi:hypothetical protein [Spiroplasma endosymbiont of Cantharis nigra]|uniref:hypothetical protein n=1 Tax=Spiroplasma endosymbiont of Cantharis nigra TaxID=3066278 RepID=UPI0030CBC467
MKFLLSSFAVSTLLVAPVTSVSFGLQVQENKNELVLYNNELNYPDLFWNNNSGFVTDSLSKGWSGGAASKETTKVFLGNISKFGINYNDLENYKSGATQGDFSFEFKDGKKRVEKKEIHITSMGEQSTPEGKHYLFQGDWNDSSTSGWAYQGGEIKNSVLINKEGDVFLWSRLWAKSTGAVTYTTTKVNIKTVKLES